MTIAESDYWCVSAAYRSIRVNQACADIDRPTPYRIDR